VRTASLYTQPAPPPPHIHQAARRRRWRRCASRCARAARHPRPRRAPRPSPGPTRPTAPRAPFTKPRSTPTAATRVRGPGSCLVFRSLPARRCAPEARAALRGSAVCARAGRANHGPAHGLGGGRSAGAHEPRPPAPRPAVVVTGNAGAAPELRTFPTGAVASVNLAVPMGKDKTSWWAAFGPQNRPAAGPAGGRCSCGPPTRGAFMLERCAGGRSHSIRCFVR
jgi:hypothetical protein